MEGAGEHLVIAHRHRYRGRWRRWRRAPCIIFINLGCILSYRRRSEGIGSAPGDLARVKEVGPWALVSGNGGGAKACHALVTFGIIYVQVAAARATGEDPEA